MMQPASGVAPAAAPPPPMAQQPPPMAQQTPPMVPQYYQAPAPQYYQAPPQPMWNQQPSQVPPPAPVPPPPPPQAVQMPVPVQYQTVPQTQPPPQQQPQQPQPQYASPVPMTAPQQQPQQTDEIRTLWIGDLQYWMDESYLHSCFYSTGEVVSIKVIRNKQTGMSEGYGFIEFATRATAERVLQTYSGQLMPNVEQKFRLNWATLGAGEKRDSGPDYSIFVGDLAADVTDTVLLETFKVHYPSVRSAKVVIDRLTGCSKGYGFVKFGDATEQARAMTEMNGMFCSTRRMRIGPATNKKTIDSLQQDTAKASYQSTQATQSESDPNNTTIFVGALDQNVTDDQLRQVFGQYGELVHVKIPVGKRCGFVQFATRACAEEALLMLNGTQLGGQNIRLSWGRSPANKQVMPQQDPNQWNGGYYGFGQGYQSYGYTQPAQDPNMQAYGAYSAYPNYQQQQ